MDQNIRKKLLMTASSYEHLAKFHLPYLKRFKELGWETHIAGANMPPNVPYADKAYDFSFRKHEGMWRNLATIHQLRNLVKTENYTLVITHTTLGAFLTRAAMLSLRSRPKVIYMCHGYLFSEDMPWYKNNLLKNAEKLMAPVTDLLLEMNRYDYHYARRRRLAAKTGFVPGIGLNLSSYEQSGINTEDTKKMSVLLRKEYGIKENDIVLLYAAEFSARKSQEVLIEAMHYLPENIVLALPGSGKLLEKCRKKAETLGRRVIFPGYVDEIAEWYHMADIAVTSSRTEGLPFNVMEAMYFGLPIVASDVKGHEDLITEGKTGLLYPYGNAKKCACQIKRVVKDSKLRRRLIRNARKEIDAYTLSRVMPVVMDWYMSVLQ